jgi:hypothetical protein
MTTPSSSRPDRSRERKRGTGESKLDPDLRAANLLESLSPEASGISPEVQKQLILELLEATSPAGEEARPPLT